MARRKKDFWIPYAENVNGETSVWINEAKTVMKAESLSSFPKFLLDAFQKGPTHLDYKITASTEGTAKTIYRSKTEAEFPALKVVSDVNKSGIYDLELVKKVRKHDAEMYLSNGSSVLLILNKDGSCGLVAHCFVDVFEAVNK